MPIDQYPCGDSNVPRRLIIAGTKKGGRLRGQLVRLQSVAERKREAFRSDTSGSPSESRCSAEMLENIRNARDEEEARKLKAVPR